MLAASTLHAFHDLFGMLAQQRACFLFHEDAYPIARLAAGVQARVETFGKRGGKSLSEVIERAGNAQPVIVTDGFLPSRGVRVPLARYMQCVAERRGLLVIDDTQALGIFGSQPEPAAPFGKGGGGSLRYSNIGGANIVVVSSLAKAFGTPVAMIAGSGEMMTRVASNSFTRVHCSPPSAAVIAAASRALEVNRLYGNAIRDRLARRVAHLRCGLAQLQLLQVPGLFPVQPIRTRRFQDAGALHELLLKSGVRTVLARVSGTDDVQLHFIVTARHRIAEIDLALTFLARALENRALRKTNSDEKGETRNGRPVQLSSEHGRTSTENQL